ncbi:hypothetical protein KFE25_014132 [Diacronema lutheri]|uniref:histidine kinase n=1 Tax=Diacronema lutheri TaxID=2081491 RepID=A0A8J5XEH4_DIALT|nr:hypothetical protein KFE25_014132 [Diacronema lutheri]
MGQSPARSADLSLLCCFRDASLEARYRQQREFSTKSPWRVATRLFLVVIVAKTGVEAHMFGAQWTIIEALACTVGAITFASSCAFSSGAFDDWHHDARSNLLTAFLVCLAAYQPVHDEYRIAKLVGGDHGARILAGKSEFELSHATNALRACAGLALCLVQDLDVARLFVVLGVNLGAHAFWHAILPLPGCPSSFRRAAALQVQVVAFILLAAAHMNRVSRESFFYRISALEQSRVRADEVLKASIAEAAQLARSRLIRVVMHDLRSPLLAVSNVASMLAALPADAPVGDATVQEAVDALGHCSALAQNIVSDVLDFERIDSGRMVLAPSDFRVRELLRGAEATFSAAARERGVRLSVEMPTGETDALLLNADMRRLQQVLNNGVSNALKFTDAGGHVAVRARVRPHEQDGWGYVHLTVTDTGIGLGADELQLLCQGDAFAQVGRG